MAGKIGQKWSPEKRRSEKKCISVAVEITDYNKIEKIADKKGWSVAKVIRYFVKTCLTRKYK